MARLRYFAILVIAFSTLKVEAAPPWNGDGDGHTVQRKRLFARGLELELYHPKSTFKTYLNERDKNNSTKDAASLISSEALNSTEWKLDESTMSFVTTELGINSSDIQCHKNWSGANGKFAFMKQHIRGIPVANAVANVAYSNTSQLVAFGSSFIDTNSSIVASSMPSLDWEEVVPGVENLLNGTRTGSPPSIEYLARSNGSVALTYAMQIRNMDPGHYFWVEAFVCAHSGKVLSVTDFTADAAFNVVPIHKQNFFDGREILVNPEDLKASPERWIASANTTSGVASGNNVIIFVNGSITLNGQQIAKEVNAENVFDNPYDPNSPLDLKNLDATIDNAFYVMNVMHDFSYRYGFQENQGNFQEDDFGKGASGGRDPVQVSIHDTTGINNAQFSTPPDGIPPVARFFFFQQNNVIRDSAFANDILIHEYTHGITNRMTGGGTARCLQTLESGGMGEGWSDMVAVWLGQTSDKVGDFKMGTFVDEAGIRTHPYSTDEKVNPLKYSDAGKLKEVHAIGEVWTNTLYNVYGDLVAERGFGKNAVTQPDTLDGNVVFMHNMIDGLLLQPCNPTMVESRDAILAADAMRYNGANQCTMWRAFARKGMGVNAGADFVDDFNVPAGC